MEQGRQRMLQKWAEPPWGAQQDLVKEMAAAAKVAGEPTLQQPPNVAASNGPAPGPSGQTLQQGRHLPLQSLNK